MMVMESEDERRRRESRGCESEYGPLAGQEARGGWLRDMEGEGRTQGEPVAIEEGGVDGKGGLALREGQKSCGDGCGFQCERGVGLKCSAEDGFPARGDLAEVEGDEIILVDRVFGEAAEGIHRDSFANLAVASGAEVERRAGASS